MFLNQIFKNHRTVKITVQLKTQTETNGTEGPITWPNSKTVQGIVWRGSMADSLVSQKFRADVSAVAIMKPSDITMADIPDTSRLEVTNEAGTIEYYSVIAPDDIAGQGKVLMLVLKEYP